MINAALANQLAIRARRVFEEWLTLIRAVAESNPHPCIRELIEAIEEVDVAKWKVAWETREHIKAEKERFRCY